MICKITAYNDLDFQHDDEIELVEAPELSTQEPLMYRALLFWQGSVH